ncbi:MAG: CinA family protein [Chitinophagaceae bacterium]
MGSIETDKALLETLAQLFKDREETIAAAESVTAGLVQFNLSGMPEASVVFNGGITAYNLEQKTRHLKVDPVHAARVNCVSERVAVEMAAEVAAVFDAAWGIGITGYAAPVPESDNRLFAYYAIVHRQQLLDSGILNGVEGQPVKLQAYYTHALLVRLLEMMQAKVSA